MGGIYECNSLCMDTYGSRYNVSWHQGKLDKIMYYYIVDFRNWIYDGRSAFSQTVHRAMAREIVGNALNNSHYKVESSAILGHSNAVSFHNSRKER